MDFINILVGGALGGVVGATIWILIKEAFSPSDVTIITQEAPLEENKKPAIIQDERDDLDVSMTTVFETLAESNIPVAEDSDSDLLPSFEETDELRQSLDLPAQVDVGTEIVDLDLPYNKETNLSKEEMVHCWGCRKQDKKPI